MEKSKPARNSRTCTADLLTWSSGVSPPPSPSSVSRSRHPSDGMGKVLFGGDVTDEEAESLYKRRNPSAYKLKEMSGSNIFSAGGEDIASESGTVNGNANYRTSVRIVQQGANVKSRISFSTEEKICQKMPINLIEVEKQDELTVNEESKIDKLSSSTEENISQETPITQTEVEKQHALSVNEESKIDKLLSSTEENISQETPITQTEVEKQHELSGNQETRIHRKVKQLSEAKSRELSGSNIFGPPIEVPPRSLTVARSLEAEESKDMIEPAPRTVRTSVKVSNPAGGQSSIFFGGEPVIEPVKKIHNQKVAELYGNHIFKQGDDVTPPGSSEKSLSRSKLREMSGSGIFSDAKAESRVCYGGVRQPPGGESSIRLF